MDPESGRWLMLAAAAFIQLCHAIINACQGSWMFIAPAAIASYFGTGDFPSSYGLVYSALGAGALIYEILYSLQSFQITPESIIVSALLGLITAIVLIKPPLALAGRTSDAGRSDRSIS